jgi:hypothetical protein
VLAASPTVVAVVAVVTVVANTPCGSSSPTATIVLISFSARDFSPADGAGIVRAGPQPVYADTRDRTLGASQRFVARMSFGVIQL